MADIFREIDEELRQDNLKRIWTRYRYLIVGGVAALLLGTAGYVGWKEYQSRQQAATAESYSAALALVGEQNAEATDRFADLAQSGSTGYAALARLEQAALLWQDDKRAEAIAALDALAGDSAAPTALRELATVLGAQRRLEAGESAGVKTHLATLIDSDSAWRHLARELAALAAEAEGNRAEARELLRKLTDDLEAPQGARARAAELLQALPE
ncbi:tetratricopeptide repeat protein [Oceanibaculum nanhaiense]|uniref:tetratricopeptide repeat protein n=1 Tax=Oceanibaculum nanhaiense TaxID=1909734 RepID=UPI001594BFD5|nr:tetratricopeptide repeat protein [Oceanibaculum nanhaiense]MDM7946858.1 tetratricopeptide repeat protein [Oceanibaculum nanhaiense]